MKIALPEGGEVKDRGLSPQYGRVDRGYGDFAGVAKKFADAGAKIAASVEKAKQEADTIAVTDAETGYQGDITTALQGDTRAQQPNRYAEGTAGNAADDAFNEPEAPTGFLYTKGMGAAEKSTATLDWLEKRRQERSKKLANDEQRRLFDARTGGMYEDARRRVEGHVTQERRAAAIASTEARKDAALQAIASDPLGESVKRNTAGPEGSIRAHALSAEDAEAKVRDWRSKVAATRIDALLGDANGRNWRAAEAVLNDSTKDLGADTVRRYREQIGKFKLEADVAAQATLAIESHRDPATGFVDEEKARDQARTGTIPEQRKAVQDLADHLLNQEAEKKKAVVDAHASPAWTHLVKNHTLSGVDPRTKEWLQDNAPKEWAALEAKEEQYRARVRAAAAARRAGDRPPPARDTRDQLEALGELQADIVENPDKYADMTPEEFNTEWGPRLGDQGYRAGTKLHAGTKDDDRVAAGDFSKFVTEQSKSMKLNKRDAADFAAAMGARRRALKGKEKREPNPDELEEMRQSATAEVATKRLGGLLPDGRAPAYKVEGDQRRAGESPPSKPGKVRVKSPKGQPYDVDEAGLDAWLEKHPGWTKIPKE